MERIGIAASKMAKGNLYLYNLYVVGLSFLFSLFIFLISGLTVLFALIIIGYIGTEVMAIEFEKHWPTILTLCMLCLTILVAFFNLVAILKNIKLPQK